MRPGKRLRPARPRVSAIAIRAAAHKRFQGRRLRPARWKAPTVRWRRRPGPQTATQHRVRRAGSTGNLERNAPELDRPFGAYGAVRTAVPKLEAGEIAAGGDGEVERLPGRSGYGGASELDACFRVEKAPTQSVFRGQIPRAALEA